MTVFRSAASVKRKSPSPWKSYHYRLKLRSTGPSNQLSKATISISGEDARRLAVTKQHLAGKLPAKPTREHILSVVRDLTFVQWDPIAVVAPSHVLSFWNRVGDFPLSDLEKLLWEEKKLFLHWVNFAASIVLTEDYPLYYSMMKRYPESIGKSWGSRKPNTRKFLADHKELGKSMLKQLKKGPLQVGQFKEYVRTKSPHGWTPEVRSPGCSSTWR